VLRFEAVLEPAEGRRLINIDHERRFVVSFYMAGTQRGCCCRELGGLLQSSGAEQSSRTLRHNSDEVLRDTVCCPPATVSRRRPDAVRV
jgi:hypothetical protein